MKGRNPLVIILVVLLLLGLGAALFFGSERDIATMGEGAENIQKPVSSAFENVDGDRLPQEFTKLIVDLRDMQQTLDNMSGQIGSLEAENTVLKQSVNRVPKNNSEYLSKPDEVIFPLPTTDPSSKKILDGLDGDIGKFIAPIGMTEMSNVAKDFKTRVMPLSGAGTQALTVDSAGMVWLQPMDAGFVEDKKRASSKKENRPSMLADLDQNPLSGSLGLLDKSASRAAKEVGLEVGVDPRFTIADGSIITNALTVTAMVGRIPVDGNITDPWRFKISTGANIVMPNGHELQGLEKTIVQGDAIGDLNLRCVSGRIDTMTFIFSDGRIVTHKTKSQGRGKSARSDQFLGYISDQYANPCIPGELITNAPQSIAQMGLLGVAAGMADGIAEAETQSTITDRGNVIKNVVGDQLTFAGYKGLATGINDVRGWFAQRMGQYFDVIYARAGQVVDIHITQEIKIDYDPTGRKVRYEKSDASDFGYMD